MTRHDWTIMSNPLHNYVQGSPVVPFLSLLSSGLWGCHRANLSFGNGSTPARRTGIRIKQTERWFGQRGLHPHHDMSMRKHTPTHMCVKDIEHKAQNTPLDTDVKPHTVTEAHQPL